MKHFFFGGVTPVSHKENTRKKPIVQPEHLPPQVVIPLRMSAGDSARPLVRPGAEVCVGQPIAWGEGMSAPVHASVSGQVLAIEERPHPWGDPCPAIVIQNNRKNTPWPHLPQPLEPNQVTLDVLLERIGFSGIVDMDSEGCPTREKLRQAAGKTDTLIVNAAESEPYLSADYRLMLEHSDKVLQCAQTVALALGAQRAVIVTSGDKLRLVEIVERRLRRHSSKVELCVASARYPLDKEKQLIQSVTGREVPPGGTPLDLGCVILNVATIFAIHQALFLGKPLTHRAVTVTGGAVIRPRNLWVPIGTPLKHLLPDCLGLREEPSLVITGSPMMGIPQTDWDAPVVKDTNALVCLTAQERRQNTGETVCIRCGRCVSACPMHLVPSMIVTALRQDELHKLPRLHPQDCISCGCCSYLCPARIPLVELVQQAGDLLGEREVLA